MLSSKPPVAWLNALLPPLALVQQGFRTSSHASCATNATTKRSLAAVILLALALAFFATQRTSFDWTVHNRTVALAESGGDFSKQQLNDCGRQYRSNDAFDAMFEAAAPKLAIGGPCAADNLARSSAPPLRRHRDDDESSESETCARNFRLPRSVITEEGAARVRCTSSFANAVRRGSSGCNTGTTTANNTTLTRAVQGPRAASICVFYLNYRNLDNLAASVKTHTMRSHCPDLVSHTVLTMDEDERRVDATCQALRSAADVHRMVFPPGTRGGDPLPLALRLISLLSSCPLTVVSDSDAFMLRDGWDHRLMTAFLDPQLTLFASNPRHHSHGEAFRDVAEWNWMAYRTAAFAGLVIGGGGPVQHIDVGHYYSACVGNATQRVHLQGTMWPYNGKAATVVTDTDGAPWILHLFYASRHANEPDDIKTEARQYSLSDAQLSQLRLNLTRARCLDPRAAFGMA